MSAGREEVPSGNGGLTRREQEIVSLLGDRLSNKESARKLGIPECDGEKSQAQHSRQNAHEASDRSLGSIVLWKSAREDLDPRTRSFPSI
jgi:hypothetical protein